MFTLKTQTYTSGKAFMSSRFSQAQRLPRLFIFTSNKSTFSFSTSFGKLLTKNFYHRNCFCSALKKVGSFSLKST